MTDKPTIYLCGAIQHDEDNAATWRDEIKKDYGYLFEFRDPLDKYDSTVDAVHVHKGGEVPDGDVEVVSPQQLVEDDKELIRNSDGVFVNWKEVPCCGTPMEVLFAWERGIPVTAWFSPSEEASAWLNYHTIGDVTEGIYRYRMSALIRLHDYIKENPREERRVSP